MDFSALTYFKNGEIKSIDNEFKNKKLVMFGVPGAFTPTCNNNHVPSFIENYDDIIDKNIDMIVCIVSNDIFVMENWKNTLPDNEIFFVSDGSQKFASQNNLCLDCSDFGMGMRSQRFLLIVENEKIIKMCVEQTPITHEKTDAKAVLKLL